MYVSTAFEEIYIIHINELYLLNIYKSGLFWYPAGYPVSLAEYPAGWIPDIRLAGYRISG